MVTVSDAELADLIAARQERDRLLGNLRLLADVVARYAEPDGLSAHEAMTEVIGLVGIHRCGSALAERFNRREPC